MYSKTNKQTGGISYNTLYTKRMMMRLIGVFMLMLSHAIVMAMVCSNSRDAVVAFVVVDRPIQWRQQQQQHHQHSWSFSASDHHHHHRKPYDDRFTTTRRHMVVPDEVQTTTEGMTKNVVPFYLDPNTKGGVLVLMTVLFALTWAGDKFLVAVLGYDEIQAGITIGMGFTVISTLAWMSTYLFRVATKDMTYVSTECL
jgi:Protein of unknown function (DUF3007)